MSTAFTPVSVPGFKQAKYTTHIDDACETPSVLTIDIKANWEALNGAPQSAIKAAISIIDRSMEVLEQCKKHLKQQAIGKKEEGK